MRTLICCLLLPALQLLALQAQADSRQVFSPESPAWMAAVGKLLVPGQKWENADTFNYDENCSATLIGSGRDRGSRYILSAWHCLEHYRDLSKPILFSLPRAGITREAFIVASGGSMNADWALLRLQRPVSPQQVRPFPAYGTADGEPGATLTMAGYSSDAALGQGGAVLTYDVHCQTLATSAYLVTTDCTAFKGASGGPVVMQAGNSLQLLGVISAGDSNSRSLYVPTALFSSKLRLYLAPP